MYKLLKTFRMLLKIC